MVFDAFLLNVQLIENQVSVLNSLAIIQKKTLIFLVFCSQSITCFWPSLFQDHGTRTWHLKQTFSMNC